LWQACSFAVFDDVSNTQSLGYEGISSSSAPPAFDAMPCRHSTSRSRSPYCGTLSWTEEKTSKRKRPLASLLVPRGAVPDGLHQCPDRRCCTRVAYRGLVCGVTFRCWRCGADGGLISVFAVVRRMRWSEVACQRRWTDDVAYEGPPWTGSLLCYGGRSGEGLE
jgi:hypothetical protein